MLESPCPLQLLLFSAYPPKNYVACIRSKKNQSVAFIWGVAFIRSKKIGAKAWPLFGVFPVLIQKKKWRLRSYSGFALIWGECYPNCGALFGHLGHVGWSHGTRAVSVARWGKVPGGVFGQKTFRVSPKVKIGFRQKLAGFRQKGTLLYIVHSPIIYRLIYPSPLLLLKHAKPRVSPFSRSTWMSSGTQ